MARVYDVLVSTLFYSASETNIRKKNYGSPTTVRTEMNLVEVNFIFTCGSYAEARLSYRLNVCPSVRPSHAVTVSKRLNNVMFSSPHDSPIILVFCISRSSRNSDGVTLCGAAKQRWDVEISQFSTNNLLYLRNG